MNLTELSLRFYGALYRSEHFVDQSDAAAEDGKSSEALRLMAYAMEETEKAEEYMKQINVIIGK